jgi:hypothetical protein
VTYSGLGFGFFTEPCGINVEGTDHFVAGPTYQALETVAQDTVTVLLSGHGNVQLCGNLLPYVAPAPGVAAVFGAHEQTARLIAATVLASLMEQERRKAHGTRASTRMLAERLVPEIVQTLTHNGDPAACQIEFEASFRNWSGLSALKVPTTVSKTGWCEKSLALPWDSAGHIRSCEAQAICKSVIGAGGAIQYVTSPPPAPTDPRVAASAPGTTPSPPPTKAEIEAEVRRKMVASGETVADRENKQEFTELAAYLKALGEARRYLTMALGIPDKSTDAAVAAALGHEGIATAEVLDWFLGCNFEPGCFREQMNLSLGEARRYSRDTRAKIAVAVGGVLAVGFLLFRWRR